MKVKVINPGTSQEVVAEDSAGLDAGPGDGSEAPAPAQTIPETPA